MMHPGMRTSSIFNTQHVATRRNRVAKRVQHVAPNNVAICCADMLRSFGRSSQMLGQQCCDMLCWYVAIVWPGLDPLVNIAFVFTPKKAALPAHLKLVYLLALASREKKFSFKVHLTPQFFFAKTNLFVEILLWKNFWIWLNLRFSVPRRNLENSSKT